MPITASFSVTQTSDCTKFRVIDTTLYDGSEHNLFAGLTGRVLNIYKSDGTLFSAEIPFDYIEYPDGYIDIENLTKDYALTIIMTITPTAPVGGSVYEISDVVVLTCFSKTIFFERQNKLTIEPPLISNNDFLKKSMQILINIEAANNAMADDNILSAQEALDRIQYISENDSQCC